MGYTYWPLNDKDDFNYQLRVDDASPRYLIDAEIEYWMEQIAVYSLQSEHRATILKAVRWMNELPGEE